MVVVVLLLQPRGCKAKYLDKHVSLLVVRRIRDMHCGLVMPDTNFKYCVEFVVVFETFAFITEKMIVS